jgi:20S proteasome alpha/beta subunit
MDTRTAHVLQGLPKRPQKPYIPWRFKERAKLTIAAALTCETGIVLCADTEQTIGEFKFGESKIISQSFSKSTLVFAIVGAVAYATMAVQEIIRDTKNSPQDHDTIENNIKTRISDIYTRLLYPHPAANYPNSPFFDLLIAVWAENRLRLLVSSESAVTEVKDYDCRGVGQTLAKYLINPMYVKNDTMSEKLVTRIALRALLHVKKYVSGCGGESEIVLLTKDGQIRKVEPHADIHSDLIAALDSIANASFFFTSDLDAPDNELSDTLDFWKTFIMREREKARTRLNLREEKSKT